MKSTDDSPAAIGHRQEPAAAGTPVPHRAPSNPQSPEEWKFERLEACPVCREVKASTVAQRTVQELPLQFCRCQNCGLTYQNPRFTRDSLAQYFSSSIFIQDPRGVDLDELLGYPDYFEWDKSYTKTASLRLKRLTRFKKPPGELLEIGTATGSFLNAARSIGFHVRGLDLSTRFAEIARKSHSLDIDVDYIEEASLPRSHYDVVCNFGGIGCWRDPVRALRNVHRSLKRDGVFVLNHFDNDSLPGRILGNRHFEYNHASLVIFSKRTMQQTLLQAGFQVVYSETERQYASLGRIVGYLKQASTLKALRALRLQEVTIPMIVPGTIFAICRKIAE